ncbi:UDP-glucose 4-epimerase GalE [Pyruvatibacter mobilis]|uniref:UDP-glucose 4-epimerase n=1 Tax=Pyruvatibacter mobilis TaxID=1712261 RepID=A0A845Q8D8_9HYPH|nr:UDP-glucose 4-epimerase GalE [Pyruvatibacter mobilis]NBG94649.1 UDP-glucose 4-epimerase GalE [Pyruvatibacter mobilis]QJD74158.1 UDP-glucose 4-epimerase GalE [Pyruvatibacter mobilis]
MTVLVTGGAGYIGSHTVLALSDRGEDVVVLDNLSTGFRSVIPEGVELVVGDIGDRALLDSVMDRYEVDAVIHFAGSIVVPDSVTDPLGYYLNNTVKTRELLAAAVVHAVPRFIFSSTAAVYGMPEIVPVTEDTVLAPISPYGSSKLMTEWMLRDTAAAHPLNYVALRYFNVAGADPQGRAGQSTARATHLIKVAVEAATGARDQVSIFGTDYDTPDGTGVRDYIHVSDLAAAHLAALDHLRAGEPGGVFNCGYGHGASVRQVLDTVQRVSGQRIDVREEERRAGDPASLVSDPSLLRQTLDWTPQLDDLAVIVEHALRWEQRLRQRPTV